MAIANRRGMRFLKQPIYPPFTGGDWVTIFEKCITKKIQFVVLVDAAVEDTHGKFYLIFLCV